MPNMLNLDKFNEEKTKHINAMAAAFRSDDEEAIKNACEGWQNFMTEELKASAELYAETADKSILAARGVRQLTQEETKFYNKIITNAKNEGVIAGVMDELPQTVLEDVITGIRRSHPLLSEINFQNTSAVTKWIINAKGPQSATWDELNTGITTKLEGAIESFDLTQCKLTAYMFCTQDMLALGPQWVDAYVRATLSESISIGLETAIVFGTGKKEPIGMVRNFTGTYSTSTGFPVKSATKINDFGPDTFGAILAKLAFTGERKDTKGGSITPNPANGDSRPIDSVILVVNPVDYFSKVMPATTMLVNGGYAHNVFPFPTKVIQSTAVPTNHAVIGIAKNYFMGIGTPTPTSGKLETSDDYKFLEDLRTYKIKLYGNGRPVDMTSFEYLDISDVKRVSQEVEVTNVVKTKETA
jgi:hypothetical protein